MNFAAVAFVVPIVSRDRQGAITHGKAATAQVFALCPVVTRTVEQ